MTVPATPAASLIAVPARGAELVAWQGCAKVDGLVCVLPQQPSVEITVEFADMPVDLTTAAWRHGDMHTHSDHSSDGSLGRQLFDDMAPGNMPLADIIGAMETAGIDFLPVTDHRTYDQHYDPQWTSDAVLLIPGEEANGSPHATVHGAVDTIDQNASIEGEAETRVVQESVWLAHSQGAVWVSAHPDDGLMNDDGTLRQRADALGVDAAEFWNRASEIEAEIDYAEQRWNDGFRFGIVGASDNHFKEFWLLGGTPARPATEVLTSVLTERAVLDGLRDARTQLHSRDVAGPSLTMDADFDNDGVFEVQAGQEVFVPAGTTGQLRLRLHNGLGTRVVVYAAPGRSADPIANWIAPGLVGGDELLVDVVAGDVPTWYRAEVRSLGLAEPSSLLFGLVLGPYDLENLFQELLAQLRAATSPIFVSEAPVAPTVQAGPPPDSGTADGAEYALGAPGEFAGFADAAWSDGVLHVVGEVHDAVSTRVQAVRREANGEWSAPLTLATSDAARFARVAAHGSRVAVVWQDERRGQTPRHPAIYLRVSEDAGKTFGGEVLVRELDGRAEWPDVAVAADGTLHIVWQEIRPEAAFDVWYASVTPDGVVSAPVNLSGDGKTIAAASVFDARSARYPASVRPAIALDLEDRPLVVWQDNRDDLDPLWTGQAGYGEGTNPDDWQIRLVRLTDGMPGDAITLGDTDRADRHPDVSVDALGRVHVVWDSKPLSAAGVNLSVRAVSMAPNASDFGDVAVIGEYAASTGRQPRLGLDADGVAQLVWFDSRSADWRWRVMGARFEADGWDAVWLLNSPGINTWPVVAGPYVAFSGTRYVQRMQRDRTQQIFVVDPGVAGAAAVHGKSAPWQIQPKRLAPPLQEDDHEHGHGALRDAVGPWALH